MASESTPKLPSGRELFVKSLEIQLAAFNTGLEFWRTYVSEAAKLSTALNDGIREYKDNPDSAGKVIKKIADAGTEHLRALSKLSLHLQKTFTTEMESVKGAGPGTKAAAGKATTRKATTRKAAAKKAPTAKEKSAQAHSRGAGKAGS